jgi:glutathione peroxidase
MPNLYDIPVHRINGESTSLADYRGKALLIVNTASKCGLTPQYDALEKLYERRKADGLEVLGFPANDFAGQEPGSNEEIASFCKSSFGVSFPMFQKIAVTGPDTHPIYQELIAEKPVATVKHPGVLRQKLIDFGATPNPEPGILWNFEKFVVDRNGQVVERFSPDVVPDDPLVLAAIEKALNS